MKYLLPMFFLILAACASGPSALSRAAYADISIGSTREEVIAEVGKPIHVTKKDDGSEEFEYVERLTVGGRLLQERRYFILLKDGVVISKRFDDRAPPPTTFDSYEMQTTQWDQ